MVLRRLNRSGIDAFQKYIELSRAGHRQPAPVHLLDDPETSQALSFDFDPVDADGFNDRAEMGTYLVRALGDVGGQILHDEGFWSALGLRWFDQLCVQRSDGSRKPGENARYVLESQRRAYRHLAWGAWWAIDQFGEDGEYLLLPITIGEHPLEFGGGEVMGQIGANQMTTSAPSVIRLGRILYADPSTGRQRRGSGGKGRGSPRRFVKVLRQFQLTYDFGSMDESTLKGLLPKEFTK